MGGTSRSCHNAADLLKKCLRETECYKSGKFTLKECLQQTGECKELATAYFVCMRGQLDMRQRIQGFKATD